MCLDDYTKLRALCFFEFQENHRYQIRILAKNEVGVSEPLETEEPYTVQKPTGEQPLFMLIIILPVGYVYADIHWCILIMSIHASKILNYYLGTTSF